MKCQKGRDISLSPSELGTWSLEVEHLLQVGGSGAIEVRDLLFVAILAAVYQGLNAITGRSRNPHHLIEFAALIAKPFTENDVIRRDFLDVCLGEVFVVLRSETNPLAERIDSQDQSRHGNKHHNRENEPERQTAESRCPVEDRTRPDV